MGEMVSEKEPQGFVFVSYAHANKKAILNILELVSAKGYDIWYDDEIRISSSWSDEIAGAIVKCQAFIVFISPESASSSFVRAETEFAFSAKKKIIPVYLDCELDILPSGLLFMLNPIQGIFSKMGVKECAKKICEVLEQDNLPKSIVKQHRYIKRKRIKTTIIFAALFAIAAIFAFGVFWVKPYIENRGEYKIAIEKDEFMPSENMAISIPNTAIGAGNTRFIVGIWRRDREGGEFERSLTASPIDQGVISLKAPKFAGEYELRTIDREKQIPITKLPFKVKRAFGIFEISAEQKEYVENEKIVIKVRGVPENIVRGGAFVAIYAQGDTEYLFPLQSAPITAGECTVELKAPSSGKYEIAAQAGGSIDGGFPATDTLVAKIEIMVLL
ncbi:hypothetical protein FACS189487_11010 [Campylobacterota bacterium]|nr:hypothetical protein FACS189487_11010 [Campylobacterota bacterium]